MSKGYNGWTNYQTWVVNLWIDNEQALYEERRERVAEFIRENTDADGEFDRDAAVAEVSGWLKSWVEDDIPEVYFPETVGAVLGRGTPTMYTDLLSHALAEVDWDEIAAHDVDDAKDEVLAEIQENA